MAFIYSLYVIFIAPDHYPRSRGSFRGEINERREGRASGHIGCKSHFHTLDLGSEFEYRI